MDHIADLHSTCSETLLRGHQVKENNIFYSEEAFKNHFTLVNYFQLTKISADFEQETVVFRGIGKVPIILIVWIWIDSG